MASRTDVWLRKARGGDGFKQYTHRIDAGAVATDGHRLHLVHGAKVGRKDADAPDALRNLEPINDHRRGVTVSGTVSADHLKRIARFAKRVADAKLVTFYADAILTAAVVGYEITSVWKFSDGLEWNGRAFEYQADGEALFTLPAGQLEDAMMGWDPDDAVTFSVNCENGSVMFEGAERLALMMQVRGSDSAAKAIAEDARRELEQARELRKQDTDPERITDPAVAWDRAHKAASRLGRAGHRKCPGCGGGSYYANGDPLPDDAQAKLCGECAARERDNQERKAASLLSREASETVREREAA